jgi:transcription elongation factor SPT5
MDDTVKEHGGESRQGRVHHIHRGALFVTNREILENAGVFVVRSSNVVTMAAKSGRTQAAGPDLSGMNPALQTQNGGIGGGAMAPPTARPQLGRDRLIGKTVTIRKGVYKGLLGIVKGTMNDEARIELHTKNKQVTVKKDVLTIKDPLTGNSVDVGGGRFPGRPRGGGFGGATPGTGRTPSWGGAPPRGPSWGGATPSGGRTPGWGGGGGRTPGWGGGGDGGRTAYGGATAYGGGDGSRTAYGGDGSRTAYGGGGDGSRTAYGGATAYGGSSTNDGSRTAYGGAGGRTPGWGGGGSGSTPASRSNLSAPTPGGYNAPTPAPYSAPTPTGYGTYSAPTPGAPPMDAPTPGTYSASTPGYGGYAAATPTAAPTPGAWAETPGGDDDAQDPHYD